MTDDPEYEELRRSVPPGWYPAANDPAQEQYWSGDKWTDAFRPVQAKPVAQEKEAGSDALVMVGYITALLLPVIGFVLGTVLLVRRQTVHGLLVLLISVAVGIAACALVVNDAEDDLDAYGECIEQADGLRELNRC